MIASSVDRASRESIDWSILKKLPMDGTPHERLIWKLSMLAVKYRLKPAFLYSEFKSPTNGQLVSKYAERIGLAVTFNAQQARLIDPTSPVEVARHVNGEGRGIWIYRRDEGPSFASNLADLDTAGRRGIAKNQGTLLGYPACCVQWYEDSIEKPQGLKYMEFLSEQEIHDSYAARRAMETPEFLLATFAQFSLDALENEQMRTILYKSLSTFPFITHVACPSCVLSPPMRSPSSLINAKLGQLAMAAGPSLHRSILKEASDESKRMRI